VRSTANVPPQRPAAAAAALVKLFKVHHLPLDVANHVVIILGGVCYWTTAMAYRDELMTERSTSVRRNKQVTEDCVGFSKRFNLCEH